MCKTMIEENKITLNKIIFMAAVCLGNAHQALRANVRREQRFQRMCRGIWLDKHNRLQVSSLRSGVVDCGGKSEMEGLMECKAPNNLQIAS